MKLRGDLVAVILADYRMPEMSGIEFLEQAMDIYPGARRVLLTAYADTGAAIDAINVVDLDHYLLKPWDPPEEKLYPVVDALLDAWMAVGPPAGAGDQDRRAPLVGAVVARCASSWPATRCPIAGTPPTSPKGERLLTAAGADGLTLPVVITPDGDPLIEPTDAELAGAGRPGDHARRRTSTTSSSSAAARPGSAPRCTAPRRGCAPCWSSSLRPAARPGRARGSRTTWAFPTGCRARS